MIIKTNFEEELNRKGTFTYTCKGVSMLPLLHQQKDLFTIQKQEGRYKKYDVVLYKRPPKSFVLHRVVEVREQDYVILGDNCLEKEYGITDEDILSAILWHTTGKPAMSIYEKITFLADYLEPFRNQPILPSLDEVRQLAFQDIDIAVCIALKNTIQYIKEKGYELDETTMQTFLYYNKVTQLYENPFSECSE